MPRHVLDQLREKDNIYIKIILEKNQISLAYLIIVNEKYQIRFGIGILYSCYIIVRNYIQLHG